MQKRTVRRKEISPYAVKKNKGPKTIVHFGSVYIFNGYGWMEERVATSDDCKNYPQLIEDEDG